MLALADDAVPIEGGKAMSKRDDEADPQTKIRLINPLAYTHSGPPFGNCDRRGKAGAPYVAFSCGPDINNFCDDCNAEMLGTEVEKP
jgi:hypothetical protein